MAARTLTTRFCDTVQAVPGKQVTYPDDVVRGLEFRVSKTGQKTWCFRYRGLDAHQRRLTIGTYSTALDVKEARIRARKARSLVDDGKDPAGDKRREKHAAKAQVIRTFDDLAQAYFKACEDGTWTPRNKRKRARSLADETGVYRRHIKAVIGPDRLEEITRARVRNLLKGMTAKGITAQANRAQQMIRAAFSYAVAEERLPMNPVMGMPAAAPMGVETRTLDDPELKALWQALKASEALDNDKGGKVHIGRPMAIALRLIMLLLNRRNEVAGMALSELNLDGGLWLIPGERMKGGKPHMAPLPPLAVDLIKEAIALNEGVDTGFVFPSPHNAQKPIRADSVTHAMAAVTKALGIEGASPHDLRRTGASAMTSERLGISPFIRSKVLGHADTGGGAAVSMIHYDVNTYLSEKRRALQGWENLLLEIVGDRAPAQNVARLRTDAA